MEELRLHTMGNGGRGETVEKEYSYARTARGKMFPQGGNIPGES